MLRHVFYSPRLTVPDNIVKQIAEGRPVVLALLCSGLRTYYRPTAEEWVEIAGDAAVTGAKSGDRVCDNRPSAAAVRYKAKLADLHPLSHITVEVEPCPEHAQAA